MRRKLPAKRSSKSVAIRQSRVRPRIGRAQRKKPATSSRSIWKPKHRLLPKKRSRSIKKPRSVSQSNGWQGLLLWLLMIGVGGWLFWLILVWGIVPRLLAPDKNQTIAILPKSAGGVVLVAQLEPEFKDSILYQLNGEEQVELPGQYGKYKLSAIYPLLLIDSRDNRYFRGTLNRVFGVFFDDEELVSGSLSADQTELSDQIKSAFWQALVRNHEFSAQLLRTWYLVKLQSVPVKLDSITQLVDKVRSETGGTFAARDECRIAILNSTNRPGLATTLSEIVEKNGGFVVRLGQYPTPLTDSRLLYDPTVPECTAAIDQLKTLSPVPFELQEDRSVQGTFRAPVVAILGANFE
ncbi:MAG: hypothetical protein COU66_03440 [Candidatus Pacebacteria bacterium CG10_big_fil_rev_8_21_14_0_10_44_11]|nr:MAG: hypothetical protein COU66_03440 [Candidatus Pacebacteria bacterium CG10_big_fil_rev_8_21_14_0_10_44_11]